MNLFKEKIAKRCETLLREKIQIVSLSVAEIRDSMENEGKSSSGDKHETARARMHLELEKLSLQLQELEKQMELLQKAMIHHDKNYTPSHKLVHTSKGVFFIAIPLGKVDVEGEAVFVISPASPLGRQLTKLNVGEQVQINETEYKIEAIS